MIQPPLGITLAIAMSLSSLSPEDKILVTTSLTSRVASTLGAEYRKLGGHGELINAELTKKLQAELPGLAKRAGDQVVSYHFTQKAMNCQMQIPVFVTDTASEYDHVRLMGDTGQIKAECNLR